MPRTRRITRALGYAAITLALLTAAAWLASGWYGFAYRWSNTHAISLAAGWMEYDHLRGSGDPAVLSVNGWEFWPAMVTRHWRHDFLHISNSSQTTLGIPFWPLVPILATLGFTIVYITRPRPSHLCPNCHYDLCGLPPTSPRPECGRSA